MAFVLGLGLMFAMSSFKNNGKLATIKTAALYTFVNVNYATNPNSTTASDYEYRPATDCNFSSNSITCKAEWLETNAPTIIGQNPTGSYSSKEENGIPAL